MFRLSSNLTLFFKIFLPAVWITFFGALLLATFLSDTSDKPLLASTIFRYGYLGFFIVFLLLILWILVPLKRVEYSEGQLYITNYFKTYKFPMEVVKSISYINFGRLRYCKVTFNHKSSFGKKIVFLGKSSRVDEIIQLYPHLKKSSTI